jgi:DNA-3-methyladenine glycosylase
LGWQLHRRWEDRIHTVELVEVEAYTYDDPASHAYQRRQTPRNAVMFGPSGYAYVYLIYGIYHCLNIVCERQGTPGAVLIRAATGLKGPGVLCRDLQITKALNGVNLLDPRGPLWISPGTVDPAAIVATKRIGINQGVDLPWRFCLKDHPDVSVKPGRERPPKKK